MHARAWTRLEYLTAHGQNAIANSDHYRPESGGPCFQRTITALNCSLEHREVA